MTSPTSLGSPAAGAGLAPTQTPFSIFSPSSWNLNFWNSAPAAPNPVMEGAIDAARQLTQALTEAANKAMPEVSEELTQTLREQIEAIQIGVGDNSDVGSMSGVSDFVHVGRDRSDAASEVDGNELLQAAQQTIRTLTEQLTIARQQLEQAQQDRVSTASSATSDEEMGQQIAGLKTLVELKELTIKALQKNLERFEAAARQGNIIRAPSFLGARVDGYVQALRVYYQQKGPFARLGIISALSITAATVIWSVSKVVEFATDFISGLIWGPYDPNDLGPERQVVPFTKPSSVPTEVDEEGEPQLDSYGNRVINYRQAILEQLPEPTDAPLVDQGGIIDQESPKSKKVEL